MNKISIIGSTGSIGLSTLRVVEAHPKHLSVVGLAARQNAKLLSRQAKKFRPQIVCLYEKKDAGWLEKELKPLKIAVVTGDEGLIQVSTVSNAEKIVFAMVGACGLKPILAAMRARKIVAVANKEPLVMAGELLCAEAKKFGVKILPIDSEHSGLWQCLESKPKGSIKKLVLTSSGGPFFGRAVNFNTVTIRQALRHPRWKMGPKISIDSATLMNKGLEVIEASNLFDFPVDQIDVVIHPEAVVHAMIEFIDGSLLAQLGITDMRLPIQYALSYPDRFRNTIPSLNLTEVKEFHFYKPDAKRFPCIALGYEAKRVGGTMPAVLNAANEIAVNHFLKGVISFSKIPKLIGKTIERHRPVPHPTLDQILEADRWARAEAEHGS